MVSFQGASAVIVNVVVLDPSRMLIHRVPLYAPISLTKSDSRPSVFTATLLVQLGHWKLTIPTWAGQLVLMTSSPRPS